MNTNKIEQALSENTKQDLTKLAKDLNTVIENFCKEKGIAYNYLHFENEDRLVEKLDNYEATTDPTGRPYFDFYYKRNDKYECSLGGVEKIFYNMVERSFYEDLQEKKVKNLINKVNLLED